MNGILNFGDECKAGEDAAALGTRAAWRAAEAHAVEPRTAPATTDQGALR